jgi:hypothetical protein
MFLRCTPQTVYRRFHGQVKSLPARYLAEVLAEVPEHFALVACSGAAVVALASSRLDDSGEAAELGILIEDAWQQRGLGRELVRLLAEHASSIGVRELHAQMLTEQDWIIGMLKPYGECSSVFRPGIREVRVRTRPDGGPAAPVHDGT